MNHPFSSFTRQERLWAYIAITVIIAAIVGFAGYAGMLLHQKIQKSNTPAAKSFEGPAPLNTQDNLANPPNVWNAPNGGSTNGAGAVPAPVNSQTNSN